jgi:tRNA (cytidine/uridine-2'-O-)-methyltransferase
MQLNLVVMPFFRFFLLFKQNSKGIKLVFRFIKLHFILMSITEQKPFNIVLVEPEIPPNTGSIARLCGATNTVLHLVHPLGFSTDDKHLRRAGLDYWQFVNIIHWDNLDMFLRAQDETSLFFFTTKVDVPYFQARFKPGDFFVFGKETKGLSSDILKLYNDRCYTLPMFNAHIRSLNLAMAAGIVLYEAVRQNSFI